MSKTEIEIISGPPSGAYVVVKKIALFINLTSMSKKFK